MRVKVRTLKNLGSLLLNLWPVLLLVGGALPIYLIIDGGADDEVSSQYVSVATNSPVDISKGPCVLEFSDKPSANSDFDMSYTECRDYAGEYNATSFKHNVLSDKPIGETLEVFSYFLPFIIILPLLLIFISVLRL